MTDYCTQKTITTDIILKPNELHSCKNNIFKKIKETFGTCNKDYGYVIDIESIDWDTMSGKISRINGDCLFSIQYTVQTLKPEEGHEYTCVVDKIFQEGVFVLYKYVSILVPSIEMNGWKYDNDTYINEKENRVIRIGDWVRVRVNMVRYKQHSYQCIASII